MDFSAERSFGGTAMALGEHYNIKVSLHAIDKVTREAAKAAKRHNASQPTGVKPADVLISQTDGSMLPIVSTGTNQSEQSHDKRKHRDCHWKELRISTASNPDTADTHYGVALGEPLTIGCMMHETCKFKGMHPETRIHAVSDGARWIAEQYELHFGTQCRFLLDFYHACEYLADAAQSTSMDGTQRKTWLEKCKNSLRESQAGKVIAALEAIKPVEAGPGHPVDTAMSYLEKRHNRGQLDYKQAIEDKLPIGSGEVESAHRHLLQKRLKIPGAWWHLERAEEMAQLRALRANNRWNELWHQSAA